jgi:hypothetical protein
MLKLLYHGEILDGVVTSIWSRMRGPVMTVVTTMGTWEEQSVDTSHYLELGMWLRSLRQTVYDGITSLMKDATLLAWKLGWLKLNKRLNTRIMTREFYRDKEWQEYVVDSWQPSMRY